MEDEPWKNAELRSFEEGLPQLKEKNLERRREVTRPPLVLAVTENARRVNGRRTNEAAEEDGSHEKTDEKDAGNGAE